MVIRISLLLLGCALIVFLVVDVLNRLAVPLLPKTINFIGIGLLLGAFGLLLATTGFNLIKVMVHSVYNYFSIHQRMQRKLLFTVYKQQQIQHLFTLKTAKLAYLAQLKRSYLLRKNNQKHLCILSKTIEQELRTIKNQMSIAEFKRLRIENIRYKKDQNIDALLKLQEDITAITRT